MRLSVKEVRPLEDRLILRMLDPSEEVTTDAGLIVLKDAQEKTMLGVVTKAGRGRYTYGGEFQECEAEEGDVVLIGKMAGTEFEVGPTKYTIVREADAMARWPKAGALFHLPEKEGRGFGVDAFLQSAQLQEKATGVDQDFDAAKKAEDEDA